MNKKIYDFFSLLSLAAVLFAGISCEQTDPVDDSSDKDTVSFPELVKETDVEPGTLLTFTIQPDKGWSISIPVESFEWFKILDGKFKVQTLSGVSLKEPKTITIWTTEEPSFSLRSCEVKMTIGEETRTVAEYTLRAEGRTVEVYPVAMTEDGRFSYADGAYIYDTKPLAEDDVVELVWDENERRYSFPVEVKSNYDWTVEWPEWARADINVDSRVGDVPVEIYGVNSKLPMTSTDGEVIFKHGDDVKKIVKVRIPGSQDKFIHNLSGYTSLYFDHACYMHNDNGVYSKDPVQGYFFGPESSRVVVLELGDNGYELKETPWLSVVVGAWDNVDNADVLQSRTVSISAPRYAGSEDRNATIVFLPATAPSDVAEILSADRMSIKEEYSSYAIPVVQAARPAEYITFEADASERESAGLLFVKAESDLLPEKDLTFAEGSRDWQYELSYIKEMATAKSTFYIPEAYETITVLDAEGNEVIADEHWLSYNSLGEGLYGQIQMDMSIFLKDAPSEIDGYVVFKDETGKVLSIVHCKYKEEPKTDVDVLKDVSAEFFADPQAAEMAGATIHEVVSGPTYIKYKEHQAPIYFVKFTKNNTSLVINTSEECQVYSCAGKKNGPEMVTIDDQMFIDKEIYQQIEDYNNGLIDKYPDTSKERSTMGILTFGKTSFETRVYPGYSKFNMKMPDKVTDKYMSEVIQFGTQEAILFVFICELDLQ